MVTKKWFSLHRIRVVHMSSAVVTACTNHMKESTKQNLNMDRGGGRKFHSYLSSTGK